MLDHDKVVTVSVGLSWLGTAGVWSFDSHDLINVLAGLGSLAVSAVGYRVARSRLRVLALQEKEEQINLNSLAVLTQAKLDALAVLTQAKVDALALLATARVVADDMPDVAASLAAETGPLCVNSKHCRRFQPDVSGCAQADICPKFDPLLPVEPPSLAERIDHPTP